MNVLDTPLNIELYQRQLLKLNDDQSLSLD